MRWRRACAPASAAGPICSIAARTKTSALFEGLMARVRAEPGDFADASALAKGGRCQPHQAGRALPRACPSGPGAWLRRERVRSAARDCCSAGDDKVVEVGYAAGFESESVFHRQFLALTRMTPGAYRAVNGEGVPVAAAGRLSRRGDPGLPCPRSRRADANAARASASGRRWADRRRSGGAGAVAGKGRCLGAGACRRASSAAPAWRSCMKPRSGCWASTMKSAPFETRHAEITAPRRGLRLPNIPTGFDGLCLGHHRPADQCEIRLQPAQRNHPHWRAKRSATCAPIPRRSG